VIVIPAKLYQENEKNSSKEEHIVDVSEENNASAANTPLWRNWAMIAAISLYCIWGLHDMAYSEVKLSLDDIYICVICMTLKLL
jgi:hypothetical protein